MHCFCTGFLYLCSGLIQNVMAKNLLNKYVWLVETIYKAKKITFEEINEKWMDEEQGYDEKTKTIKPLSLSLASSLRMRREVNTIIISRMQMISKMNRLCVVGFSGHCQ